MKKLLSVFILLIASYMTFGQVAVPYTSTFDVPADTAGWTTHNLGGGNDWEWGAPTTFWFNPPYSPPNAWVTDLDNNCLQNATRSLNSPYFNLSDTTVDYILEFRHKGQKVNNSKYWVDYKVGKNGAWNIVYDYFSPQGLWQDASNGFTVSTSNWRHSRMNLRYMQGVDSVQFRFRFDSNTGNSEGWIIDNFQIVKEVLNVYGVNADTVSISSFCGTYDLRPGVHFANPYTTNFYITTNFYLSHDTILDPGDSLVHFIQGNILGTDPSYGFTWTVDTTLSQGYYYLFYHHDVNDSLEETNENDNIAHMVIHIDSTYAIPYSIGATANWDGWRTFSAFRGDSSEWQQGPGYLFALDKPHSGNHCWHTCGTYDSVVIGNSYLESPYIDLSSAPGSKILNLWWKHGYQGQVRVEADNMCGSNWQNIATIFQSRENQWDFKTIDFSSYAGTRAFKFRINYQSQSQNRVGIMVDDLVLDIKKPDISVEGWTKNRFTDIGSNADTIHYKLVNSGPATCSATTTAFFWSLDSILDGSDIHLGNKLEPTFSDSGAVWTSFAYSKQSSVTKYYILYVLDTLHSEVELREYNNYGYFTIRNTAVIPGPYSNNFDLNMNGWRLASSLGDQTFVYGPYAFQQYMPPSTGFYVYDTLYNDTVQRNHLYSPIFDLSNMNNPVLEFDLEYYNCPVPVNCQSNNIPSYAAVNLTYSIDGGATWHLVDIVKKSFKGMYPIINYSGWVGKDGGNNYGYINMFFLNDEPMIRWSWNYLGRDVTNVYRNIIEVSHLKHKNIQFRVNVGNGDGKQLHAITFDNFSITEKTFELSIPDERPLMLGSNTQQFNLYHYLRNDGNHRTDSCKIRYFLSMDPAIDASDTLIGDYWARPILPNHFSQASHTFSYPQLSQFKYVLAEIDWQNTVPEINESNNVGVFRLALDSITQYPYTQHFTDSVVDGWNQTTYDRNHVILEDAWRWRTNQGLTQDDRLPYFNNYNAGQSIYTERLDPIITDNSVPFMELSSPSFDLTKMDSVVLKAGIFNRGDSKWGANLRKSEDGGLTWREIYHGPSIPVTTHIKNWYWIGSTKQYLNGQRGWTNLGQSSPVLGYDTCEIDYSDSIKGKVVQLQFQHRSKVWGNHFTPNGMSIDFFTLDAFWIDYEAMDSMVTITVDTGSFYAVIPYNIASTGQTQGRITRTKIYWSLDSIFDAGDSLMIDKLEPRYPAVNNYLVTDSFQYPLPVTQDTFYVFYTLDTDSVMVEMDEDNNVGSFRVIVPRFRNYLAKNNLDYVHITPQVSNFNVTYTIEHIGNHDGDTTINEFYWSTDPVLDFSDSLLFTRIDPVIPYNDTISKTINVTYPLPISLKNYYLIYHSDANDTIKELVETDNYGSFRINITYLPTPKHNSNGPFGTVTGLGAELHLGDETGNNTYDITLFDQAGRTIVQGRHTLYNGKGYFKFPETLAEGIYILDIVGENGRWTTKAAIVNR